MHRNTSVVESGHHLDHIEPAKFGAHLERLLGFVDRRSIFVLPLEYLIARSVEAWSRLLQFLGVEESSSCSYRPTHERKNQQKNKQNSSLDLCNDRDLLADIQHRLRTDNELFLKILAVHVPFIPAIYLENRPLRCSENAHGLF